MANYDVVERLDLPIFTSPISWGTDFGLKIDAMPYKTINVPIYEYGGQIADMNYLSFPTLMDIQLELAAVYNNTGSANVSLGVFNNFSNWVETGDQLGTAVQYSLDKEGAPVLTLINGQGSSGLNVLGMPDYVVIVKSVANGKYFAVRFDGSISSGEYFPSVSGETFSVGISTLISYTGSVEHPEEPEISEGIPFEAECAS